MAGLLYEAALRCGFAITERYSHSMDIYREAERFTPLGLDAAVVFGYKDLRFVNTTTTAVEFHLRTGEDAVQLQVFARHPEKILPRKLVPLRFADEGRFRRAVVSILDEDSNLVASVESTYLIPDRETTAI